MTTYYKAYIEELTARVGFAPEHDRLVLVLGSAEDIMKLNSKPVKVSNMQWPEIVVKCIV